MSIASALRSIPPQRGRSNARRRPCLWAAGVLGLVLAGPAVAACPDPPDESEPNDATGTANALVSPCFGADGVISLGDVDFYAIPAINGARLWLLVDIGSPPVQTGTPDVILDLYGDDGVTLLESDDDDGTGNGGDGDVESVRAAVIAGAPISATGDHYARVSAYGAVDAYRLVAAMTSDFSEIGEVEPNDTAATANPNQQFQQVRVATLDPNDIDLYSFVAPAGADVFVAADGDRQRSFANTDVDLRLISTDGATLLLAATSGGESNGHAGDGFHYVIPAAGRYYVHVTAHTSGSSGKYDLLITGGAELRLDGFETGDTSRWSGTEPP